MNPMLSYYVGYTPQDWQFGFSIYFSQWFEHQYSKKLIKYPNEYSLYFGPWSFNISVGREMSIELKD